MASDKTKIWACSVLTAYKYNGWRLLRGHKITGNENYAYAYAAA